MTVTVLRVIEVGHSLSIGDKSIDTESSFLPQGYLVRIDSRMVE